MPNLISVKMTKQEVKDRYAPATAASDAPLYPYGLTLRLDNDTLDKLKVRSLPEVGESMLVLARVNVTSVSSSESDSGKNRTCELQITDLALDVKDSDTGRAGRLYDGAAKE
jgi:hypothetical protein